MISLIEALNYRSLRYIRQPLDNFHVLIGPNASGKTTFLDVVAFLGRLVADGVEAAITERTENFVDLLWLREGKRFELAIEAELPDAIRKELKNEALTAIRYEVAIGVIPESATEEVGILEERVFLKPTTHSEQVTRLLFPEHVEPPATIIHNKKTGWNPVFSDKSDTAALFEETGGNQLLGALFEQRIRLSVLSIIPWMQMKFPATTWLSALLSEGTQDIVLNSAVIRRPSPPNQRSNFRTDGSNLPWVVNELQRTPERYDEWIRHLQTSLPDLVAVNTILRPEDRHRYLMLEYTNGLKVPSWMVSDGTLRMLALTLLAYLPNFKGIYLIEEPENGIHPTAVETVFQSLSSVYDAQLLLATHSPVILNCATAKSLLCFAKNDEGATDIVTGENHPRLQEWKGKTNLGVMFASGVLG